MDRLDVRIRRGDRVLVADGRKAILMVNEGDAHRPRLRTELALEDDNPKTSEQGTDRPGHFDKGSRTRRGAFEPRDLHDDAEERFSERLADLLERTATSPDHPSILLIAPPRMLGHLRTHMSAATRARISAELDRDLTGMPVPEIEALLSPF